MYESRIFKGFLLKYLMTCLLTLLINFRIQISHINNENFYLGDFDDISPLWFKSIGYSLMMTFLLKIFASLMFPTARIILNASKRFYDRKFKCSGLDSTRKKTHNDLENLYMEPNYNLDFHYTEMLNIIFVGLTLGPLMPAIYYVAVLYLIVLFWKDKFLCRF